MSNVDKIAKDLAGIIKSSDSKGTAPYDTKATVKKVENGIAWVQIPGGVDETPVQMTLTAKEGDTVQVRVSGGRAWITGNGTAPPTDDARANDAYKAADKAYSVAENAIMDAQRAHEAADSAEASAEQAQTSAENAGEYAARALGNLSTVQSVTETLNWITQHGTMTLTTDTSLDPTHVYFVRDNDGDYEVGNYHYSVVTEPKLEDISTYYVLSIDESLNNYVGTHLAVTSEGLWILPEGLSANSYKILIATGGQGHTYEDAGTYIIDSAGKTVAKLGEVITLGLDNGTQSYLQLDYHSMQMMDNEGQAYFYVSDLRGTDGTATVVQGFTGDGTKTSFIVLVPIQSVVDVTVGGVSTSAYTHNDMSITFDTAPADGRYIRVVYKTTSNKAKAYTFGLRNASYEVGLMSVAEGIETVADSAYSHAEGQNSEARGTAAHAEGADTEAHGHRAHAEGQRTKASGYCSHAEGYYAQATGRNSHAQNEDTTAASDNQTAIGRRNIEDANNMYALIIGNGDSYGSSNALTVAWDGNIELALDTTAASGTTDGDLYAAITALGWQTDVIV